MGLKAQSSMIGRERAFYVLGLSVGATTKEVRKSKKALALLYHSGE